MSVGLLGGRRGSLAVFVYLLLGAVGAPVFSGFNGGVGALVGTTGGYILGFLLCALTMWTVEAALGKSLPILGLSMVLGLIVCYCFGTAWFLIDRVRKCGGCVQRDIPISWKSINGQKEATAVRIALVIGRSKA